MEEDKMGKIAEMVEHFKDKVPSQTEIDLYTTGHKMDKIVVSQLEDYKFEVAEDLKTEALFNDIRTELQNLRYTKTYISAKESKEIDDNNEEVSINIAKIIEKHAIMYRFLSTKMDEIADMLRGCVSDAGTRIFNKMTANLRHLAYIHFGSEFNTAHSKEYTEIVMKQAEEKNAKVSEEKLSTDL